MFRSPSVTSGTASVRALWLTGTLVMVTGVGPLATDMYLAGLPEMQRSLGTSATAAQLTLTAFLIGMAAGQIVVGPLSDGRGRRTLLLSGVVAFTLMCVVCAIAPNGPLLVAARLIQGLAVGCGLVVGRAVVADVYKGDEAAKRYGTLAAINFLSPVIAPALGGLVLIVGTWRTVFWVLGGLGVIMTAAVWFVVPETLAPADRHSGGLRNTAARMADLLRDWQFMRHVTVQCLAIAGFFTYIGGSSFVLQTVYGISPERYAAIFATNATAMAVSSLIFRLVVVRVGSRRLRAIGLALACSSTIVLLGTALAEPQGSAPLILPWVCLSGMTFAMGLVIPASTVLGQQAGDRARGTAAALLGGMSFFVGALMTPLTGVIGYTSLLPMALLMAGFFAAATALDAATGGWSSRVRS